MKRTLKQALKLLTLALSLSLALAACATNEKWHPVTVEESQILAASRFQNFDNGLRQFKTSVTTQGQDLYLQGWYDFASHTGYAAVVGADFAPQALLFTSQAAAIRQQAAGVARPLTPQQHGLVIVADFDLQNVPATLAALSPKLRGGNLLLYFAASDPGVLDTAAFQALDSDAASVSLHQTRPVGSITG